jgi:glycerol-3-phosphate dehydrogenase
VASVGLLHGSTGVQGAVVRDALSGREFEVRAALTINATGPWVDRVLQTGPRAVRGGTTTLWTRNINLVTRRLYPGDDALGVQSQRASDAAIGTSKRLFFTSPWHGCTVVGTTHDIYEDDPDTMAAPDDVIAGFLQEVNDAAPGFRLEARDVRSLHLGLTPSEDAESERAKRSLLLDHESVHQVPGLVSVAGIKYTTAPVVAAKTLELVCRKLQRDVQPPAFERPAAGAPPLLDVLPTVDDELAWARRIYGTRASECLAASGTTARDADEVFRARVNFGINHEMVVRLSDALLRATDWAERGLLTQEKFSWCAKTLAKSQGWDTERTMAETGAAQAELKKLHISVLDS